MNVAIVVGFVVLAAVGATVRFGLATRLNAGFPFGTLAANIGGAFALGAADGAGTTTGTLLGVALLGALTTLSTFVLEVVELTQSGQARRSAAYVLVTLVGGIAAAAIGLAIS